MDSYVKEVLSQLVAKGYNPYTDGLKVHTNLDLSAQKHLYNAANNSVAFQSDKMQTGVAVVDPNNGQIVAMLGGRKTGNVVYGLNRAVQTDRSSGSTVKPLMDYGPAIQYLQWPTYKSVEDTKFVYPGTNKVLHDFDNQYKGTMTMRGGTGSIQKRSSHSNAADRWHFTGYQVLKGPGYFPIQGIHAAKRDWHLRIAAADFGCLRGFANGGTYYKPYLHQFDHDAGCKTLTYHQAASGP